MDSPFLGRLNKTSKYDPTPVEFHQIRNIISQALEERSRIETEITSLFAHVDKLRLQQHKIDEFVDAHRSLIPDVHRLPIELIQMIFCWCLPPRNSAMSAKEAPLLLGRVCKAWKEISHSTPQLWSTLHLHATSELELQSQENQRQLYGAAVEAWLRRSGRLPLSLSFTENKYGTDKRRSYFMDILVVLRVLDTSDRDRCPFIGNHCIRNPPWSIARGARFPIIPPHNIPPHGFHP